MEYKDNIELVGWNGYIRNWRTLCCELNVCTENKRKEIERQILVKGYEKWGYDLGNHLCGSAAVSIRDNRKNEMFYMRDHFGIKAMYYTLLPNGRFICSYELSEILDAEGFEKKLNTSVLRPYLVFGYVPRELTFFENVKKLLPGHYLVWDGKEIRTKAYWEAKLEPDYSKSEYEWADIINKTAQKILNEDSDIDDALLSGGVDSSYLLALSNASNVHNAAFNDGDIDESVYAEKYAAMLGKNFDRRIITAEDFFYTAEWLTRYMEQPLADASSPEFALCCLKPAKSADYILSGEGADEFFGGYNEYTKTEKYQKNIFYTCSPLFSDDECNDFLVTPPGMSAKDTVLPFYEKAEKDDMLSIMQYIDINIWLEGDILRNTDRSGRICGAEISVPFCDIRMFDIARKIPMEYKFKNDISKYIFRKAAESAVPYETAYRKKIGFYVPASKWMADDRYNSIVKEKLFGDISRKFFRIDELEKIWQRFNNGESYLYGKLYAVYIFIVWYGINFEGKGHSWPVASKSAAKAVFVYNCNTNETIYEKNAEAKLPVGSIAKLAAALVIAEKIPNLENTYITVNRDVWKSIEDDDPSYAGFQKHIGERFSALDLLCGSLLPSGCECAILLADFVSGGDIDEFVGTVNKKMQEIGCRNTRFCDSCGLNDDGKSTAKDIALILREAVKIPILKRIISSSFHIVHGFDDMMINTNALINPRGFNPSFCPYCIGGKTGSTSVARMCICTLFERGGTEYIAVILGEEYAVHPSGEIMLYRELREQMYRAFESTGDFILLSLTEHYTELNVGDKYTLSPKVIKSTVNDDIQLSYYSSDESVAKVSQNGVVTVVGKGTSQITVMAQTGDYELCFINSTGKEIINLNRSDIPQGTNHGNRHNAP